MYCGHCGQHIEDDAVFCPYCGGKCAADPIPETETKTGNKKGKAKAAKDPTPRKRRTGLWVTLAAVLVLAIGLTVYLLQPMTLDSDAPRRLESDKTGMLTDTVITIKSNQWITKVTYALVDEDVQPTAYTELTTYGGPFSKSLELDSLRVPAGDSQLCLQVTGLFGRTETLRLDVRFEIGSISAPDENDIVYLDEASGMVCNELLLTVTEDTSEKDVKKIVEEYDGEIIGAIYVTNLYQIQFPYGDLEEIMEELRELDQVRSVSYNLVFYGATSEIPNDSEWDDWDEDDPSGNNWGLECIDAPGAWDYMDQMEVIKVGVIDSFLDYSHEDLKVNENHVAIQPNDSFSSAKDLRDYFDENVDSHECYGSVSDCIFCRTRGHGTHCAGIIGAIADNKEGTTGVNWKADLYFCNLWYYTDLGNSQISRFDTFAGLQYAITRMVTSGCRVVSMSFGTKPCEENPTEDSYAESFDLMIQQLEDAGYDFLLFKAAGNNNTDASSCRLNRIMTAGEHARAHTVIVGSITNGSTLTQAIAGHLEGTKIYSMADYSNYGDLVDVVAPGSNIYSTIHGDDYDYKSGTSMATPMAAGVASLIYGMNPDLTYDLVKSILSFTADEFGGKNGEVYNIVNACNAVEWVDRHADTAPEQPEPEGGFLTGYVWDAATGELQNDAWVVIENTQTGALYHANTGSGYYSYFLEPGTYNITFSAEDYLTEVIYDVEITNGVVTYNMELNMVEDEPEQGTASGNVIDAFDGYSIPYATLTFYPGLNNRGDSEPVATAYADSYGWYEVTLDPGNYTVYTEADGYQADYSSILVIGGEYTSNQNCTLTPILNDGEVRIVLTWGDYPSDLDSHLVGPSYDGEFHVYYSDMTHYEYSELYSRLDVDDTSSYGPETTSIYYSLAGTYTFYVHDYSNRNSSFSTAMATSGATVKVYIAGQEEPMVFYVPNQEGTLWTVCTIRNGVVTPINEMGYESSPSNVGN